MSLSEPIFYFPQGVSVPIILKEKWSMTCNTLYLLSHGIFRCLLGLLITPLLKFVTLFTYLGGVSLHACECACVWRGRQGMNKMLG